MKAWLIFGAIGALSLSGCNKGEGSFATSGHHGRYSGVGIYPAGSMWSQTISASASTNPNAARQNDDDQVIVVIDGDTGELRQCGNLSGYCVGMNPWTKVLGASQVAPVPVAKHAEQLAQETAAAAERPHARTPSP